MGKPLFANISGRICAKFSCVGLHAFLYVALCTVTRHSPQTDIVVLASPKSGRGWRFTEHERGSCAPITRTKREVQSFFSELFCEVSPSFRSCNVARLCCCPLGQHYAMSDS